MKWIYKWHRRLAYVMAVPLILWALSGLLHPMMSNWFKPDIANKFLIPKAIELPQGALSIEAMTDGLGELHMVKLIKLGDDVTLLAITPDQAHHYRNVLTGKEVIAAEEKYAEQLARAYMDDQESALVKITKITEFGGSYSYISRFLPAYRVELDRADGLQVVVDPRNGKLATYDNFFRRQASVLFQWFHTWSFLGNRGSVLRVVVVSLMSFAAFLIAVSGLVSLFFMKGERKMDKKRRLHRWLGGLATIFFFMFSLSGFFHVVMKLNYDDSTQWVSQQKVSPGELTHPLVDIGKLIKRPIKELTIAQVGDVSYYRVALAGRETKIVYLNIKTLEELENGEERYATALALEFSGYSESEVSDIEAITSFRNDYSFIFRRMPVWRVSFKGKEFWQYTVDTRDAHMSMRTSTPGLIEVLVFINLHKFHFIDPISKDARDWVLVAVMVLILSVSFLGVSLLVKKKKMTK